MRSRHTRESPLDLVGARGTVQAEVRVVQRPGPGARSHLGQRSSLLRAVHESNHGFERHSHLETCGARLLTARFDLGVLGDRDRGFRTL